MNDSERSTTVQVIDQALASLWKQHEALQRLAAHYPEARHVLSSPRKPDAIVILERLRHWLTDPDCATERLAAEAGRGGEG